jgi:hypothetical protein
VLYDGTIEVDNIRVPPVLAETVHQPANVWPVLVGVGKVPNCVPDVLIELVGDTVPPLGFHVIVTVAANTSLAADKHKTKAIKTINILDSRFPFLIVSSSPF